jgi:predicted N-formylglutamate amidohydrolase
MTSHNLNERSGRFSTSLAPAVKPRDVGIEERCEQSSIKPHTFIVTCEHAVNLIPSEYQHLFTNDQDVLQTHRGYDIGACEIAEHFCQILDCPSVFASASRLLIDCNRSLSHRHCFSKWTKPLLKSDKEAIIAQYYLPYRQQVEALIQQEISLGKQVIHLSIHSFTPILNEIKRKATIGFLYDPKRLLEQQFSSLWRRQILSTTIQYQVRFNYPYRGTGDGLVTVLRKIHPESCYLGIEIESNIAVTEQHESRAQLCHHLTSSLIACMKKWRPETVR